jgi:hypothetical protein
MPTDVMQRFDAPYTLTMSPKGLIIDDASFTLQMPVVLVYDPDFLKNSSVKITL